MRFGVNYVPSKNWWYSWNDWDRDSIAKDLEAIASIGFDHIRIHCLWHDFQPNKTYVSHTLLDRLYELLDIADSCNLDVEISALDGWLSGFFFLPTWVKSSLTDPGETLEGIKYYFLQLTEKIGNHPRFLGYDLGNELSVFCIVHQPFSTEEGDQWQKTIFSYLEEICPGKLHTNGVDHTPWFSNIAFSRNELARQGSITSLHCWSAFTKAMEKYGALGTGSLHLCDYMAELSKAYYHRNVWIQELGVSSFWMDAQQMLEFTEKTMQNIFACQNIWGVTWWCSHDINPKFSDFHPLERDLGLLDTQNRLKPVGALIKKLIAEYRQGKYTPFPYDCEISFCEHEFTTDPLSGWKIGERYMEAIDNGFHPKLILATD